MPGHRARGGLYYDLFVAQFIYPTQGVGGAVAASLVPVGGAFWLYGKWSEHQRDKERSAVEEHQRKWRTNATSADEV